MLDWRTTASPLIILAGQHRKLALQEHVKQQDMSLDEAYWVANVYDLDSLPNSLMINMAGNALSIQRGACPGEVFRDMAAVAKHLARTDTTIVRPTLVGERENQEPTLAEFLKFGKQGQKTAVTQKFKETLEVCAANSEWMSKLVAILASPLAPSLTTWVKFGVGMDRFQIQAMYQMTLARCSFFYMNFFKPTNSFYTRVMEDLPRRHFDVTLQEALAQIQPRNEASLANLFWPERGIPCATTPNNNRMRNPVILKYLTDDQYRLVYDRLLRHDNLNFHLMSKKEHDAYMKHAIPAVRCAVPHAVRWIIPDVDKGTGRFSPKFDHEDFFLRLNFTNSAVAADNLILLVIQISIEHIMDFSPKYCANIDAYPNVTTHDPLTSKKLVTTNQEYLRRFRTSWGWFHLAKSVAQYTRYNLKEPWMKSFNEPIYSPFVRQDTAILTDLAEGRVSLVSHREVVNNKLLRSKEGRAVMNEIVGDIRKAVVTRINAFLDRKIRAEGAHLDMEDDYKYIPRNRCCALQRARCRASFLGREIALAGAGRYHGGLNLDDIHDSASGGDSDQEMTDYITASDGESSESGDDNDTNVVEVPYQDNIIRDGDLPEAMTYWAEFEREADIGTEEGGMMALSNGYVLGLFEARFA